MTSFSIIPLNLIFRLDGAIMSVGECYVARSNKRYEYEDNKIRY